MWAARQLSSHSWYPSGWQSASCCPHPAVCSGRTRHPPGCGPDHLKQRQLSVKNLGPVWSSLSTYRDHPDQKHQVAKYQRFAPELRREGWGTLPWGGAEEGSPQRWGGPLTPCPGYSRSLLVFRSGSPHLEYSELKKGTKRKYLIFNIINVSLYC